MMQTYMKTPNFQDGAMKKSKIDVTYTPFLTGRHEQTSFFPVKPE
jgi:hypothetical protein